MMILGLPWWAWLLFIIVIIVLLYLLLRPAAEEETVKKESVPEVEPFRGLDLDLPRTTAPSEGGDARSFVAPSAGMMRHLGGTEEEEEEPAAPAVEPPTSEKPAWTPGSPVPSAFMEPSEAELRELGLSMEDIEGEQEEEVVDMDDLAMPSAFTNNVPVRAFLGSVDEDLTVVEGIGPKIASILQVSGIKTLSELATVEPEELKEILTAADIHMSDPGTWPYQARLASEGKWDELEQFQSHLTAGRDPYEGRE